MNLPYPIRLANPFGEHPKIVILNPDDAAALEFHPMAERIYMTLRTGQDVIDLVGRLNGERLKLEKMASSERRKRYALMRKACQIIRKITYWDYTENAVENLIQKLYEAVDEVEKEEGRR